MSAFDDLVDEFHQGASQSDIRARLAVLHQFDFVSKTIRMWSGTGALITAGAVRWLGTKDANGTDHLEVNDFNDGRDSSSQLLEFTMPYIDEATYQTLRAERHQVRGCLITRYVAAFRPEEGLRPQTPIDYEDRYYMQSLVFGAQIAGEVDGVLMRTYPITVTAKNGNAGRSQSTRGTYSSVGQRNRAKEMYGIALDRGCDFTAELANKTFTRP